MAKKTPEKNEYLILRFDLVWVKNKATIILLMMNDPHLAETRTEEEELSTTYFRSAVTPDGLQFVFTKLETGITPHAARTDHHYCMQIVVLRSPVFPLAPVGVHMYMSSKCWPELAIETWPRNVTRP